MNFVATLRRQVTFPASNEIFIGLQYTPDPDRNFNASAQRDLQGVRTQTLSWANQVPRGEGFAYSITGQRQETPEGTNLLLAPRLEWYARNAILSGEVTRLQGDATRSTGYSLALSGALVASGGHILASRPIADAFAIVELQPPLAGVRVYGNSQEVGRSDARGVVLLPDIASYSANYASVNHTDVPIEYTIERIGRTFSPPFRGGMVVPFHIDRLRSFTGRFVRRVTGKVLPLEYHQVVVSLEGRTIEIPAARNGEFYAENLPPGRHAAQVEIDGRPCTFTLDIPASESSFISLGDVVTCNAP
jgi:outer membrane usher protein